MIRLTLGDVCKKASSNIAQKDLQDKMGAYPIYGASGLIKQVDFYQQDKEYIAVVKDGAGIGRTMLLPAYSSVIGTMQYLLPKEGIPIDIKYLFYAVEHMNLAKYFSGATIPHIYFKDYQKEPINIPDIDTQRRISRIFDKIDTLITFRKEQRTKLDKIVKSRFIEMFGQGSYPRHALIELITEGAGLSYGIVQPGDDGTGDMGVLRPVDLVDGGISTAAIKYIDRSIGDGFKKTELTGDELLITVRGTTGITALTDVRFKNMNVTRGIAVIRYDRNKINPAYLNAYLNTDESQRYIREHTRGATLQQINLADLRTLEILMPSRILQEKFAAFVAQTDKSKYRQEKCIGFFHRLEKNIRQEWL